MMLFKRMERFLKRLYLDGRIWAHYKTFHPRRIQCVGSGRTLYVDPKDFRARKRLIAGSARGHISTNQKFRREAVRTFRPDTALDVGLNYGECLFSLTYDDDVKLFGFEANPGLKEYLDASWNDHPNRRQIELIFQLVTDGEGGEADFFIDRRWSGRSTAALDPVHYDPAAYARIRVGRASIDHVLAARDLRPRRLLFKIDVEGFEYRVLEGMRETIRGTPRLLGLVEFDAEFLRRAGEDVGAYWLFLQESFSVHAFDCRGRWHCADGVTLPQLARLCGRHFHTDLVLAHADDASLVQMVLSGWRAGGSGQREPAATRKAG